MLLVNAVAAIAQSVEIASFGWTIAAGALCVGGFVVGYLLGRREQKPGAAFGKTRDGVRARVVMSDMSSEMMQDIPAKSNGSALASSRRAARRKRTGFVLPPAHPRGKRLVRQRLQRRRSRG
jgi:hypothetical protein